MPVNPELLELCRQSLGDRPGRILITGATGFVGAQVAQTLHHAGYQTTLTGRNLYRAPPVGQFQTCDISRADQVDEVVAGHQIVIHCAALTSPWGSLQQHRHINCNGTRNIIDSCRRHEVKRLVHVSSTAIFFQFRDRDSVQDDSPLPRKFSCAYAQSKAESEQLVQQAIREGLNAYIVRARAVFGPGDNALLPRLIKAAEKGRLRQIGRGENLCDLTYIDNLVAGILVAANPLRPTGVCTITNHEPVPLWPTLREILRTLDVPLPSGRIPYWLALKLAHAVELKHRLLKLPGEPAITRYGIGLLACQQTFESAAASRDLDYRPIVSVKEGIKRTLNQVVANNQFEFTLTSR